MAGDFSRSQGNAAVDLSVFCPVRSVAEETDERLNDSVIWLGRGENDRAKVVLIFGNGVLDVPGAPAAVDPADS